MAAPTTENFGILKPDPDPDAEQQLNEAIEGLGSALDQIDAILQTQATAIAGKAAAVHTHEIADVTGLQTALDAKMAATQTFAIDDLTDVDGAAAAPNGYVLGKVGDAWSPLSALAALGTHSHAMADILGLADALDDIDDELAARYLSTEVDALLATKLAASLFPALAGAGDAYKKLRVNAAGNGYEMVSGLVLIKQTLITSTDAAKGLDANTRYWRALVGGGGGGGGGANAPGGSSGSCGGGGASGGHGWTPLVARPAGGTLNVTIGTGGSAGSTGGGDGGAGGNSSVNDGATTYQANGGGGGSGGSAGSQPRAGGAPGSTSNLMHAWGIPGGLGISLGSNGAVGGNGGPSIPFGAGGRGTFASTGNAVSGQAGQGFCSGGAGASATATASAGAGGAGAGGAVLLEEWA